jgi:hypothetical protein
MNEGRDLEDSGLLASDEDLAISFAPKSVEYGFQSSLSMSGWIIFTKTEVFRICLLWPRIFTFSNPFRTCGRLENNLRSLNKSRYCINEQFLACLLRFFTPQE